MLNEILAINDCNKLVSELYFYLVDKKHSKHKFNEVEEVTYLLLNMLPDIEMEGFVDLFHQLYSLDECFVVEKSLRQLGLNTLANLFGEAKSIFISGKTDITQEEYKQINLLVFEETKSHRLDEIGEIVLSEGSEIYLLSECLCKYIKSNIDVLVKNNIQVE